MASAKAPPDMEEDPMFVIKNLDTGLEMRIDDFDKLANIATEEVQEDHEPAQKKSGLTKGTKALKHWTAATAKKASAISKKAVTGIKEAAHDLSVPSLTKHKLPGQQPEPSPSSSRGPGSHLLGSPLSDLLLVRRSTGEHPGSAAAAAELSKSSGRASIDTGTQVLESSCGVVWVVAFSRDGSFLAAAGQDCVLRVWQLTASRDKDLRTNWVYHPPAVPRRSSACDSSQAGDEAAAAEEQQQQHQQQHQQQQMGQDESSQQHGAEPPPQHADEPQQQQQQQQQERAQPPVVEFGPYFSQHPVRQYVGHAEDILDISWSAGSFLLSASLDKNVRLWHLSQPGCLRVFWHTDFVTSVQFHPLDAQRFVSGSIDGKIRVWSIAEQQQGGVLATAQLHQDMVTAVGFSLSGGRVLAGTMRGRVRFYELAERKLEYVAQVDVRNQRGQHASGKKVTGIHSVPGQPGQFLITTNDSRLRLLDGYGILLKLKGHRNNSTQIRAGLSLDGSQVVCGSDDGWVYVWQLGPKQMAAAGSSRLAVAAQDLQGLAGKNSVYQAFQAHDAGVPVTAVAFAPPGVCDGRPSVLLSHAAGGAAAAAAAADGEGVAVRPGFAGRTVQSLLVSGGFSGAIKVHELL
ncbi:hypothetical protein OEZ85_009646 [Tetradesmus obliquus]|uniref:Anaphase-promoting complex subunit 4 WD40 domain-containing protein n=1 Tax=Tetradesmus obliquus TaxID=3088 RepID=A0ABY8UCH5_TETOB|nr:hypothetical protein OEZ85_009646 [Tetradesmus obliquus]